MVIASYKILFLLFISCNVCHELYPFYLSEAASVPPTSTTASQDAGKGGISPGTIVAIVVSICVAVLIFIVGICCLIKRIRKKYDSQSAIGIRNVDLLQYGFRTIQAATNNFSDMIGKGGFANVYKGMLPNGQEIAVKRIAKKGKQDFQNEVEVLARVQHKNLVRLVGFCLQREEYILVYEYMPNKSLADILYDSDKRKQLNWTLRYKIVKGIAQGIQYLHDESRLRIMHYDIKPHNILLDSDMSPKIADFGLAVTYTVDQTQFSCEEVRGTIGYIAPELFYKNLGEVSVKCDVFSFGVLLLEIISAGGSNGLLKNEELEDEYIPSYAWRLWKDGKALELLDSTIRESYNPNEVIRCIHIALLCLQPSPADRPSMGNILLMLENYSLTMPSPSDPLKFSRKLIEGEGYDDPTELYSDSSSNGGG